MRHQLPRGSLNGDGSPSTPLMVSRSSGSHVPPRRRINAGSHHLHYHDASAAAALSPLLKAKFKTTSSGGGGTGGAGGAGGGGGGGSGAMAAHAALLSHDEKKKEEAEREEKLAAQLQLPDQGLEAADNTPTQRRLQAQYTTGGPRAVPASLRTGAEAVAAAAAVDAFYTAPFLHIYAREATEREVAARLRGYVKKMTSRLHAVRVEGLKEAMSQLLQWTTQASVESAERLREQQQHAELQQAQKLAQHSAEHAPPPLQSPFAGAISLPPYDAVRVDVLGSSAAAPGGVPRGSRSAARAANAVRSPSWDIVQQSLEGVDYTSAIFNTILVPRLEVRNAMSTGVPISIQLSPEAALQWTTLPASRTPAATARETGGAASALPLPPPSSSPAPSSSSSPPPPSAAQPRVNELLLAATAVTFEEQELALRYIQGACLTLYYQRRCCSEGCLLYYATEVFQCMRSHADALFTLQRRERERQDNLSSNSNNDATAAPAGGGAGGGGGGGEGRTSFVGPLLTDTSASRAAAGRSAVPIDPALVRVVVALVEAVEAACHYNPSCLRRLVQTSGVTAMLNLAYCPFMPTPVRSAVLNTISVLLQEVSPLRRFVAAASKPGEGGGVKAERNADPLLQCMLENAMHDNPIGHNGKQIPYSTDRGSASKFDSAVRDWFFANGLGNVLPAVMQLQDVRTVFQSSTSFVVQQGSAGGNAAMGAVVSAGPGVGGGAAAAAAAVGGVGVAGAAVGLPFGPVFAAAAGGGAGQTAGGAAAATTAATHATMQREGELYRKRVGRLLECMDGRELR